MTAQRYRVIQWATGNTGQRALRELIRDPSYDLVGVRVYDEAKSGVDAGELCGEEPVGIAATADRDSILDLDAECCVYMARATGTGQTRAGLTQDELVDDMVALLEKGTNVVTTCTDLIARAVRLSDDSRARILDACQRGAFVGVGQRERPRVPDRDAAPRVPLDPTPGRPLRDRRIRRPVPPAVTPHGVGADAFRQAAGGVRPRPPQEPPLRRVPTGAHRAGGSLRVRDRRVDRPREGSRRPRRTWPSSPARSRPVRRPPSASS